MKAGYEIQNPSWYGAPFYLVYNYEAINLVSIYGANEHSLKSECSIGVWKVKYKN